MGVKSTVDITRERAEEKIFEELNNIGNLSNDTIGQILEIIGEDENSDLSYYNNYWIIG